MSVTQTSGLESFHRFLEKQLASKSSQLMSPEEVVALWRAEQESLAAIRRGLADVAAGRTMSLEEFDRDFRQRHAINGAT